MPRTVSERTISLHTEEGCSLHTSQTGNVAHQTRRFEQPKNDTDDPTNRRVRKKPFQKPFHMDTSTSSNLSPTLELMGWLTIFR